MQKSVLNTGEQIVLAARLAAIEHVRQEMRVRENATLGSTESARMSQQAAPFARELPVMRSIGMDSSLPRFVRQRWNEFFRRAKRGAA